MKTKFLLPLFVAMSGCANFDPAAFERALGTMQQANNERVQRDNEINRALRPATAPSSPSGMMGFLQGDSISGTLRYCRYSNGVVNTITITSLCPMSIQ